MHHGPHRSWREIADKHHAALLDDLGGSFDASIQSAVADAVEAARAEAQAAMDQLRETFERRYEGALAQARQSTEAALAEQSVLAESKRVQEIEKLRGEAHQALAEVKSSFEGARAAEGEQIRKASEQALAERWIQFLRRLRQTTTPASALDLLADTAGMYARSVVVLAVENQTETESQQVRIAAARGAGAGNQAGRLTFAAASAPALQSAIESRDPVVALPAETEISGPLILLLQPEEGEKAYLFPVRGRQTTAAVVAACGNVSAAALELLCEGTGFQLQLLPNAAAPAVAPSGLVQIGEEKPALAPAAQVPAAQVSPAAAQLPAAKAWSDLDEEEQKLHLQAQRFARVQIAELRLYKPEAVRAGVNSRNIYQSLKSEIDEARKQFLNRFLSTSSSMVDYLHLEILRSLAHDDDHLLGHEYPGPMV